MVREFLLNRKPYRFTLLENEVRDTRVLKFERDVRPVGRSTVDREFRGPSRRSDDYLSVDKLMDLSPRFPITRTLYFSLTETTGFTPKGYPERTDRLTEQCQVSSSFLAQY